MANYPDVNGHRTSYASIEFTGPGGSKIRGVKSINYKVTNDIPKIKGTSALAIGRTRGVSDCEGDIELYQQEWDELLPVITQNGRAGFAELAWTINVCYAETISLQTTKRDLLRGVRFHSPERSNSEGPDALTVKVALSIMRIDWHGLYTDIRQPFVR